MEDINKYIILKLNEQSYGVHVQQVLSIERLQAITTVPRSSAFIKGVINLSGKTTPIIDLKERLYIGKSKPSEDSRVLVVQLELDDVQVGLIVDSATEVIDIDATAIETAPKLIGGVHDIFLKGVAKLGEELLILLDLERILDLNETMEVQEIVEE